jgi:hypothetical protein
VTKRNELAFGLILFALSDVVVCPCVLIAFLAL